MDVYSRRRQHIFHGHHSAQSYVQMADAIEICFGMLQRAATQESGLQGYVLSKSLQGMGELVFQDLAVLARRGLWPRDTTLSMLASAAEVAERLPLILAAGSAITLADIDVVLPAVNAGVNAANGGAFPAAAAIVAAIPGAVNGVIPGGHNVIELAQAVARREVVARLRKLREELASEESWPPTG